MTAVDNIRAWRAYFRARNLPDPAEVQRMSDEEIARMMGWPVDPTDARRVRDAYARIGVAITAAAFRDCE